LAAVEREVGIELVHRTTRRSNPTEAGLALYRRLNAALTEIEAAKAEASDRRADPSGLLRLTATSVFGSLYLVPALAAFLEMHPKVSAELDLSDRYVDLVQEGFDLAIRLGEMPDSALKARRLASLRRVVFAAPAYFARHGRPRRPDDLVRHQCIVHTREGDTWAFSTGREVKSVRVVGRFRVSAGLAASEAAVKGLGICRSPLYQVRKLVDQGKVELALTRFEPPPIPLHAVWPATNVLAAKTRLFVEFLAARLKGEHL
jgi:DNA-binding transcriptional LysR family regulator